ncbi:helix-turn-helix transcriptional regulator [Achromobacter xylosoxidans]
MDRQQLLLASLLRILPYIEDEESEDGGISMSEIRERLASMHQPVPDSRQIRRTLLKLDSVGFRGATRATRWYRTIRRSEFNIQNMNVNMAMAMCALKQVADRHLPTVVLEDLADTFADATRFLAAHQGHPGAGRAHSWARKTLRIDGTHPVVLPRFSADVYRPVTEALYYGRKLSFRNTQFGEKAPAERIYVMTPLAMVDRAGVLYMVTWGTQRPGRRFLFRMDRLSHVQVLDEAADEDPSFDLEDYVRREDALNFHSSENIEIVLKVDEPLMEDGRPRRHPLREFWLAQDQRMQECDGGFVLRATVKPSTMLWQLLHGYGCSIEVLQPESVRTSFADNARRLVERYT